MLFYTWKDIERCLLLNQHRWEKVILDVEIYSSEIIVYLSSINDKNLAQTTLYEILGNNYDSSIQKISLDIGDQFLTVEYEIGEQKKKHKLVPLFKDILYEQSAYDNEILQKKLPGSPVIAFHSYKGGVGRTLSLLAFVKAWSSLFTTKDYQKLLIVDSDIEAPGITWLTGDSIENSFSYLDLLEVIQGQDDIDEIIKVIADKVAEHTIKIETELSIVEHFVLPTYRYIEQLLDIYSSPENVVKGYKKEFILAEVLSKLGEKIGAAAVLVDLRAGVSEFSAPLLFDPRVKKYLVTSTSYQSIKGTDLLIQQLNKGLPINETSLLPEIFLTMVPKGLDISDIISELVSIYDRIDPDESSLTDNLVTELPFASELIHLESLSQITESLSGRDFYKKIYNLVKDNYSFEKNEVKETDLSNRDDIVLKIHNLAKNQINAEGNIAFKVLMTEPLNNLIKKFKSNIPITIVMGAKGSGKTFLYRELLRNKYWESFLNEMNIFSSNDTKTIFIPMLAASNSTGFLDILQDSIDNFNFEQLGANISKSIWLDNEKKIKTYCKEEHDELDWEIFWKSLLLDSLNSQFKSLEEFNETLNSKNRKVVFLIDGLEEILKKTLTSTTEKDAIVALCKNVINEFKIKYNNIGIILFLRKDMARDSIEVNFEQFNTLYSSVEIKWSKGEALKLVVWLASQAIPDFYKENIGIEEASQEIIEKNLNKLWGVKLGKATSNEAYSSRWILAALSDFNGQLQARDIIRFLQYSTEEAGKSVYDDRYIMPAEIKKAVPKCSSKKNEEIKQEIGALKPILEKLENSPDDKKLLPFRSDTFNLLASEEKIMKQEGYLKIEDDKYYLPEIIRHALKFRYEKGARPKVLSLLLRK